MTDASRGHEGRRYAQRNVYLERAVYPGNELARQGNYRPDKVQTRRDTASRIANQVGFRVDFGLVEQEAQTVERGRRVAPHPNGGMGISGQRPLTNDDTGKPETRQ
jgi:hypothetical protein